MICSPLETASIPVYVPAPIEYALRKTPNIPTNPRVLSPL